jgi:hypothetical protein
MSEARIVQSALDLYSSVLAENSELKRQLEAARSMTSTLEEEAHACPNTAHHRGWWETHEADL